MRPARRMVMRPFGVEAVVAQAVVAGRVNVEGCGCGLWGGAVGVARSSSVQRAVRSALVVMLAELSSWCCISGRVRAGGLAQPAFEGLMEALDLALGLGVSR